MICLSFQSFSFSRCQYNKARRVQASTVSASQHAGCYWNILSHHFSLLLWFWIATSLICISSTTKMPSSILIPVRSLLSGYKQLHFQPQIYLTLLFNMFMAFEVIYSFALNKLGLISSVIVSS